MKKTPNRLQDAKAFAQWVENLAKVDDWTRVLYDVQPNSSPPVRLQIGRRAA